MISQRENEKLSTLHRPSSCQDAAWAILHTPLEAAELTLFCHDIERLFRINPMINFSTWHKTGLNRYHCTGQNISQQPPFNFELTFTVRHLPDGVQIDYEQGLKTRTTFVIEPVSPPQGSQHPGQTKLTITDFYDGMSEDERKQCLHLVDKSITAWAGDLQQYLINWNKWSRYRLWRTYMQYVWQPMRPMGRRIVAILIWLTVFEMILILLGAAVYYLENSQ
ncbi:hypothetical protein [Nitrosomonas marina]|uniref:Polyketide cyclase / dehydrase and lipid transport n=1 Tax=Nitrosomonas marina TaxID=917 RepID=A0A1H8AGR2_9PROT|nr:hypothetical protein [Nitrosomonas marina]SEM69965.1 hypothetical protein SAMN05216325_101142 [Nitrosomonas marina]